LARRTVPGKFSRPHQLDPSVVANIRLARHLENRLGELLRTMSIEEDCCPTGYLGDGSVLAAITGQPHAISLVM